MEKWKLNMRLNRYEDELEDIRICGDCGNSMPNPKDRFAPRGVLLCVVTLTPVHRSRSVKYCNEWKTKVG